MAFIFGSGAVRRSVVLAAGVFVSALVAVLVMASGARAAETLYWDNYGGEPDNVAVANLDGTGGGPVNLGGLTIESPEGMAYDTATNRLFVPSSGTGQIVAIDLGGGGASPFTAPGAPIEDPHGVAVDPTTGTLYWANYKEGAGAVVWAKLDGSAGGVLNTTGATLSSPCCRVAIDTVGGRVYWYNEGGPISYANLNNTGGGGDLNLTGATVGPGGEGLAVDPTAGRLYFLGPKGVGYANLNGTGGGDVPTGSGVRNGPWGLALDPSIGRLYWGNESNKKEAKDAIGFADLAGAGGGISIATAPVAGPQDPLIVKSPAGMARPRVHRTVLKKKPPTYKLSCSTGGWAPDYPGGFVYQSPRSYAYRWKRDGKLLRGAKAVRTVGAPGKYACVVTATNQAGSATATSKPLKIKKRRRRR